MDIDLNNIDFEKTPQPEVVKAVVGEIKKLSDGVTGMKANYEELRKGYEEARKILEENQGGWSAEDKERYTKFTEDITVRQEAIDQKTIDIEQKMTERIDGIEVALNRLPKSIGQDGDVADQVKEARQFQLAAMAARGDEKSGVKYETLIKTESDVEGFKQYRDVLELWLRKYGGRNDLVLPPESLKALSVGSDPDGGYTVTPAISNRIIKRLFEADPIRALASVESITTGAIEFMVDWDEAGWGWEGETETGAETDTPELGKKRIPVHIMYAKPRATQTLLEDSGINIENWLADKVSNRFMRGEGAAFVSGDGVGKPRGFLTYPNGTAYGQIQQTGMGGAGAFTADGLIDIKYSLIEYYLTRGTWLVNRLSVSEIMQLKYGTGEYIWKPGFQEDKQASLLGLPVRMSTTMPTAAVGALCVALADWAEAYLVVDRLGITIQRDPYTVKPFVEFYTRKRVGGDVVNYQAIKIGSA